MNAHREFLLTVYLDKYKAIITKMQTEYYNRVFNIPKKPTSRGSKRR